MNHKKPRPDSSIGGDSPADSAIKVAVADTQPLFAEGVRAIVDATTDFIVTDLVHDVAALIDVLQQAPVDIVVVDMHLGDADSFQYLEALRGHAPQAKFVLLAVELDASAAIEAVRQDVHGLLLKTMPAELLITCLRKVAAGGRWVEMRSMGSAIERMLATDQAKQAARSLLSTRELQMVRFVCQGLRNKEIAAHAHVSEGTVKTHLHNIYQKLGVDSRLALMRLAQERGWAQEQTG